VVPGAVVTEPNVTHFRRVARQIEEGDVTPFLGAGANLCDRPANRAFEPGVFLPNGTELAAELARRSEYPDSKDLDLLRVSQYVDACLGEKDLYKYLRLLFNAKYPPSSLHQFLAKLPVRFRELGVPYQLIVTTNYDFALETAFEDAGEEFDVVWYEAKRNPLQQGKFWHRAPNREPVLIEEPNSYPDPSRGDPELSFDRRTIILKLHGAVDPNDEKRDSFVITEDNYIDYLSRGDIAAQIPVKLKERMEESHFLFLGYRMRDWNLRVILNRIWGARELDLTSWSVQLRPKSEAQAEIEEQLWRSRGDVTSLYFPLQDYVAELGAAVFREVEVGV
jgi:SIR2-like protein